MKKEHNEEIKTGYRGVKIIITGEGRCLRVWTEGVKRILLCLPTAVRLLLSGKVLSLAGRELSCVTYASGSVEIVGEISDISLEHRGEE